ncbi:glycosyltransferase [Hydrogenophaga sp. BPS33]|uniref:glycosyltransferase n=1 Tax=Hydrogenophaga sp. BPS33 TaxID=2651974 RepID=UPI00131FC992|nr:glycosyltransferase [Hydrogenophaga sp. BPS33]QHE84425.1 galactosyldiacylglycerol synthase [Hydrogenophaga sp. BPS33]
MTTVDLIYFNAGGGHRASALALQAVLRERQPDWQVRLVNLFEVLDPQGKFQKMTGSAPEDWYNKRLARGWTIGMAQELKLLQGMIRMAHPMLLRRLQRHWLRTEPDLVVSLVPNFNRSMCQSLASALPGVPYTTVLTDLADVPPHFWIERGQRQHVVCGTPRAVEQALALGHPPERVHATSGMIIRPEFYEPQALDRARELRRRGFDPSRPIGIVMFGGHGSKAMLGIAERLGATTQLILVCGHNKALAARLQALPRGAPRLVLGFSTEVSRTMRLADFFIGKPGPGSLSEAVQQGLPVIVVDNAWTMPQERYNAHWVRDNGLGIVARSYRRIPEAVACLLGELERYRERVRRVENRALFEIPVLLERILDEAQAVAPML